jgi:hypothetical protein
MKKTVIVDVVVVNSVMGLKGPRGGKGVKGVGIEGWDSCYQARDQSGWGFASMSKTLDLQVSWGFPSFPSFDKGFWLMIDYVYANKTRFCVQVKNKPCVEYFIIIHLISWNCFHGMRDVNLVSLSLQK